MKTNRRQRSLRDQKEGNGNIHLFLRSRIRESLGPNYIRDIFIWYMYKKPSNKRRCLPTLPSLPELDVTLNNQAFLSQSSGDPSQRTKFQEWFDQKKVRRKATEKSTWFCALGMTVFRHLHPQWFHQKYVWRCCLPSRHRLGDQDLHDQRRTRW